MAHVCGGALPVTAPACVGQRLPGKFLPQVVLREVRPMLRVLVVDDSPDTVESTRVLLEMWGHNPFIARDGAAAVKAAVDFCPDVVLLDLALGPGPDGYEVARHVRRLARSQPVIICVSGYGRDDDRRQSREAGCDHHLLKPADPDALAQLLTAIETGAHPAA
jgi:CheY-like chemotaxis protein